MLLKDIIAIAIGNIGGSFNIEVVEKGELVVTTSLVTADHISKHFDPAIIIEVGKNVPVPCTTWSEYQLLFTNLLLNYVLYTTISIARSRTMTFADASIFIANVPNEKIFEGFGI